MSDTNPARYISGVRLSPGGLHLGHLFGNVSPAETLPSNTEVIFCVKDTEPLISSLSDSGRGDLCAIVRDVLACLNNRKILITTASRLWAACPKLYSAFLDEVTVNGLIANHFKRELIRSEMKTMESPLPESNSPKLKYLLFPFDEAMTLVSLRASGLLSNDDNVRFVKFAKRLAERGNSRAGANIFPMPELVHNRNAGRLLGVGYDRMCKALDNHLPLSSTAADVSRFVDKLSSMHAYFDKNPEELAKYDKQKDEYVFVPNYLPLAYLDYFGKEVARATGGLTVRDLKDFLESLKKVLWELLKEIQSKVSEMGVSDELAFARIENDSKMVARVASETENLFLQSVRNR